MPILHRLHKELVICRRHGGDIFSALGIVFREEARSQRDQVTKEITILSQENQSLKGSVDALEKDKEEASVEKDKVGHTFVFFLFFYSIFESFKFDFSSYSLKQQ